MLLEVVVSVSILLLSMGVVGMAFRNGSLYVERAERMARAQQITQRLLGELATGLMFGELETGLTIVREKTATGSFGDESPDGMCWEVAVSPAEQFPGLMNVAITIYLGTPDSQPADREIVLTSYTQQAVFVPLNLQRDFGMTADQMQKLTDAVPGGQAMFDPAEFDPRTLARLDMETLQELLPVLLAALGGQAGAGNLNDLVKAVQEGDTSAVQSMAQQAAQQQQQPGQGSATSPPPQGQPPNRQPTKQPGGKR